MMNCIDDLSPLIFANCDNTPTNDFLLSLSRCVVGSSNIMKFRLDDPNRCAIPNLKDNAMLTCSPPLSDSNSNMVALE